MPRDQSTNMKRLVRNASIERTDVTTPKQAESNGLVIVKLKGKLQYRIHVYTELLCPNDVLRLLQFPRRNNNFFEDVTIVPCNIPKSLIISPENRDPESANVDLRKEHLESEKNI